MKTLLKLAGLTGLASLALLTAHAPAAQAAGTPDQSWSITGAKLDWTDRITGEDADQLWLEDTKSDSASAYVSVKHPNGRTYKAKASGYRDIQILGHGAGAVQYTVYMPSIPAGKTASVKLCLSDGWTVRGSTCKSISITE
ncbi:MAG: hypothetical protein HOQ05_13100 [Corynebacteriales bacterium]|nr:hypothetical protein [Mycobacteriales bacterium]